MLNFLKYAGKSAPKKYTTRFTSLQQTKNFMIYIWPTIVGKQGRPTYSGHINIGTTEAEQKQHGINSFFGHSGAVGPDLIREPVTVPLQINGHPKVEFLSYIVPSAPFSDDRATHGWQVAINMGPMDDRQAKILSEWISHPKYELTCHNPEEGTNCVEEIRLVMIALEGFDLPYIPFETPQALGDRIEALMSERRANNMKKSILISEPAPV